MNNRLNAIKESLLIVLLGALMTSIFGAIIKMQLLRNLPEFIYELPREGLYLAVIYCLFRFVRHRFVWFAILALCVIDMLATHFFFSFYSVISTQWDVAIYGRMTILILCSMYCGAIATQIYIRYASSHLNDDWYYRLMIYSSSMAIASFIATLFTMIPYGFHATVMMSTTITRGFVTGLGVGAGIELSNLLLHKYKTVPAINRQETLLAVLFA